MHTCKNPDLLVAIACVPSRPKRSGDPHAVGNVASGENGERSQKNLLHRINMDINRTGYNSVVSVKVCPI